MATTPTRRVAAGIALVGATALGGLTVAAIDPIGLAGAQDDPAATQQDSPPRGEGRGAGRGEVLDEVLDGLVADGTLDQSQADKVAAAFAAKASELREHRGPKGWRGEWLAGSIEVVAEQLGITVEELRTALQDGQTIAQVAESKGVELQEIVDALVARATERIDAALADGKIDEAKATELKDGLADRIERRLTTSWRGGEGHGHGRGPRDRGPEDPAGTPPADAPTTTTPPAPTTAPPAPAPTTAPAPSTTAPAGPTSAPTTAPEAPAGDGG